MAKKIIIVVIICLLVFGVVFLKLGIESNNNVVSLYSYTANKNSDYQVLLKENDFYENEILASDNYYASKSIDKYLIKFDYKFKSDKTKNIKYNYNVTAQLVGTVSSNEEQGKEIWSKNYILINDNEAEIEKNDFSITEQVDIDYDYYNNLARDYEDNYGISINSVLKVRFNISTNFENIENFEDYIELDIALTNNISRVKRNYEEVTNKEEFSKNNSVNIYFVISIIIVIIDIALILLIRKKETPEQIYKKKLKSILRNYSDLLVTVSNEPNIEKYTIMNINTLEDLIDLSDQNKVNIIHYEKIKNKQNNFYVFVDKFVYIYIISL